VVNSPAVFGYDVHTHILANPFTKEPELRNSYIEKFNIGGDELEFPYQTEYDIFNVDSVIAALEKQVYTGIVIPKKINDGKINLPL
jgi:hypothetical protein